MGNGDLFAEREKEAVAAAAFPGPAYTYTRMREERGRDWNYLHIAYTPRSLISVDLRTLRWGLIDRE